jgi:ABC-type transport system involved in multi-copper enzyme maturation permease subunit
MGDILTIADNVWRRILRMKVLYFLIICAIIEISITSLYKVLMWREHRALMIDTSLLLTTLSGVLCVLALAFDIPRELREGTASSLLAKPLGRTQYLIGKYFGITVVAVVVTALISAGFCGVHYVVFDKLELANVQGHLLAVAATLPMAAVALFFAALLNYQLAAVLTTAVIYLAHSTSVLTDIPGVEFLVGSVLPELELFNLRAEALYSQQLDWAYLAQAGAWGVCYSVALIALTGIFFSYRDLR